MRVLILTLADEKFSDIAEISTPNKKRYAKHHGYGFVCVDELPAPDRSASWNKIRAIQERLDEFNWIFWTDADSLIMNGDIRIEDIIGDNRQDLIMTKDTNGLNAGQFLIKNSAWSHSFLWTVWSQTQFLDHAWSEQAAIMHVLGGDPDPGHVLFVEKRVLNAYHTPYYWDYLPGDFLVHFVGLTQEHDRLKQIMLTWQSKAL